MAYQYTVLVADNAHYQDEDERYELGSFATYEQAVAACRAIVDRCLEGEHRPGMSADELFSLYTSFGEDPFIRGEPESPSFSAWSYARQRCEELCR